MDEEQKKGIVIVSAGAEAHRVSLMLDILLHANVGDVVVMNGDLVEKPGTEEERRLVLGDPVHMPIVMEEEDCNCKDIDSWSDYNNGRAVTHTPPFYTSTKRDIYRAPKGKGGRR